MVIVSHDREFLDQLCTKIVETERGVSHTYKGNYTQYLLSKSERTAQQYSAYEKQQKEIEKLYQNIGRLFFLNAVGRLEDVAEANYQSDVAEIVRLESEIEENKKQVTVPLPEAGSLAAIARLRTFKKQGLGEYAERRDLPAVQGTSQLSIYLKNGSLTTAQIMALLDNVDQPLDVRDGPATFVKELAWREFYYHVLYHRPEVEHAAHQEKYRDITWENREDFFAAWYQGRTGYPIVDAGMRQLNATGWMHNRVRMIVASFLTKDLLIDWRWGERYFMQQLLDGDLAPNNGGWQWAASTGCDAQPYFRIFSPKLQSEKFDPHGEYIRRWVPELSELSAKQIHEPHAAGIQLDYPRPIVDHQEQKPKALALYTGGKD